MTSSISKTSQTINYSTFAGSESSVTLEIDSDYNKEYYGETKTQFQPGDVVFLKLSGVESGRSYLMESSFGLLTVKASGINIEIEERIDFFHVEKEELSNIPSSEVTMEWVGNNHGIVDISGIDLAVRSGKRVTGSLDCTYDSEIIRIQLSNTNIKDVDEYDILVSVFFDDDDILSCSVPFEREEETDEVDVDIQVLDMCTGNPIPGAFITMPGRISANADSNGLLSVGVLNKGHEYDITVTATGYESSDVDPLKNDSFIIPKGTDS